MELVTRLPSSRTTARSGLSALLAVSGLLEFDSYFGSHQEGFFSPGALLAAGAFELALAGLIMSSLFLLAAWTTVAAAVTLLIVLAALQKE